MFLIAVDAHSKWPEVHFMNTITASKTIDVLRQIFAQFGVVQQIISDNGRTFTSAEFQNFVKKTRIIHKTSAPWHPATRRLVERFVQSFKQAMKLALTDGGSLNQKITCFLLQYRNAVHATTNESPAKLLLGRQLRSRLDLIKPNTRDTVEKKQFESLTATSFFLPHQNLAKSHHLSSGAKDSKPLKYINTDIREQNIYDYD